ncbi:MAG TPA: MBL fold metallo-hydrolase [Casimicrobiaceae bacterium]|nr:MBL fold metallo-hydrolase [Casimicrobiaceae bacterium]
MASSGAVQQARLPAWCGIHPVGFDRAGQAARAFIAWSARRSATVLAACCVLGAFGSVRAQPVEVAEGVYALPGTGGEISRANRGRVANVAFFVGPSGVVVVDTGVSYREGEQIIAAVRGVSDRRIALAILSHPGQEAVFGAAAFQARGIPVLAHRAAAELIASRCDGCLRNLTELLGQEAMAGSRVVAPDRVIDASQALDAIGRPLRIIAPAWSSAPGALAVFDPTTSTLVAGTLVSIHRVPDLRDADPAGWRDALREIAATRCRHLVPAYGPIGSCDDIAALLRYLDALEARVAELLKAGVGLAELRGRCDLPEFAAWDQYETLHLQNANRTYLRLERLQFK